MFPTSAIPGYPLGPQFFSTIIHVSSTSVQIRNVVKKKNRKERERDRKKKKNKNERKKKKKEQTNPLKKTKGKKPFSLFSVDFFFPFFACNKYARKRTKKKRKEKKEKEKEKVKPRSLLSILEWKSSIFSKTTARPLCFNNEEVAAATFITAPFVKKI